MPAGGKRKEETMKNLKKNSICVTRGTVACWPQYDNKEELVEMSEIRSKFNGAYSMNNSTICFVIDDEVFVTPYTREAMDTILAAGLRREYFYVPFSNWDYPKYEKARWDHLRDLALESYYRDYERDCAEWCDEHNIGELSTETMERCFKIPRTGVPVRHLRFENIYRPLCSEFCMDSTVVDKLGHFCSNNGKVVFIYHDGHTYVTKGYKILEELREAGYREAGLFVPFSNGEQITDSSLAAQWDRITKR